MYKHIFRPLLFKLDPETSHELSLEWLARAGKFPVVISLLNKLFASRVPELPLEVMGIKFSSPVGLAAGLDKEARCITSLTAFGFSHLELGTVTPVPQPGNPAPRMFRLAEHDAIINRMGFNSGGIRPFLENIASTRKTIPLGINLGKNAKTPIELAADDYIKGLKQLYLYADYFTINISSPNTKNLRDLQAEDALDDLLHKIVKVRNDLASEFNRRVPIAVKIAPDIDNEQIISLSHLLLKHNIDAVIATNTTIDHSSVSSSEFSDEAGGLSGRPLKNRATEVVSKLYQQLQGKVAIIGVGGIFNSDDAWQRLLAGADLLQVYSGFIYEGPGIIKEIVNGLALRVEQSGMETLQLAVEQARKSHS